MFCDKLLCFRQKQTKSAFSDKTSRERAAISDGVPRGINGGCIGHTFRMDYEKVYVAVTLKVDREGKVIPLRFEWEDGRVFEIDRVRSEGMAPARHVGAILTKRYDISVAGKERELFVETRSNRWFVEKPLL